jgi:hypothetical protein
MRNELAVAGAANKPTTKFRAIEDIMRDPKLKAQLNNLVDEAVRCKQRIYGEQQAIKDLRDVAANEVALSPKLFNYYTAMVFNNDYAARKENVDQLETLIDVVMNLGGMVDDAPGNDD